MTVIRRANSADLGQLAQLFDEYRQFNGEASDCAAGAEFLAQRLDRQDSVVFVCDTESGELGGFAQLYPAFSSVAMKPIYIFNDLYVRLAYRRRGFGALLIEAVIGHARAQGAARVSAVTAKENDVTQQLNERCGFARDRRFYAYHYTFRD